MLFPMTGASPTIAGLQSQGVAGLISPDRAPTLRNVGCKWRAGPNERAAD